jgi:hypothetical protein
MQHRYFVGALLIVLGASPAAESAMQARATRFAAPEEAVSALVAAAHTQAALMHTLA